MRALTAATILVTGLLLLLASSQPAQAEAGCRKQILLYLDISGGMKPKVRDPAESPFRRTVDALAELLQQPNLVQDDDVLELRLFGGGIEARERATGPGAIGALIAELRSNKRSSDLSNLVTVVEDLGRELASPPEGFERRLVIIASDFVHEHQRGRAARVYLEHWSDGLGPSRQALALLDSNDKQAFLLLTLPSYTPTYDSVHATVLSDLTAQLPPGAAFEIESSRATDIAWEIRRRLLLDPQISTRLENGGQPSLKVTVRNPNCQAVSLVRVAAGCEASGDLRPLELTPNPFALAAGASTTPPLSTTLADLGCGIGAKIEVTATLAEGRTGRAGSSATNQVEIRALRDQAGLSGTILSRPRVNKLLLYLEMRGQAITPEPMAYEIKRFGTMIAAGTFDLPLDLEEAWKTYLLPVPTDESLAGDSVELELEVQGATMKDSTLRVRSDRAAGYLKWAFPACALLFFLLGLKEAYHQRKYYETGSLLANWGLVLVAPFILGIWDVFQTTLPMRSVLPWLKWLLLSVPAILAFFLWLRRRRLDEIDRLDIQGIYGTGSEKGDASQEEPDLKRLQDIVDQVERTFEKGRSGPLWRTAGVAGALTLALVLFLVYFFQPDALVDPQRVTDVINVTPR